jgi:hypothetical protein
MAEPVDMHRRVGANLAHAAPLSGARALTEDERHARLPTPTALSRGLR